MEKWYVCVSVPHLSQLIAGVPLCCVNLEGLTFQTVLSEDRRQVTWLTLGRETFCIKPLFKRLSLSTMTNKQYSFPFDFFVRHDFLDVLLCDYSHSSPVFNHSLASYPSEFCVQPSLPHPYPQAERIHLALQLHLSPLE